MSGKVATHQTYCQATLHFMAHVQDNQPDMQFMEKLTTQSSEYHNTLLVPAGICISAGICIYMHNLGLLSSNLYNSLVIS